MSTPVSLAPSAAPSSTTATWLGYLAMCLGMFMAILDIQIVASSLPVIQAGLTIPFEQLSWVQTAYLIAEIIAIPLTGWLTRLLSLRGMFLAAVFGFTAASAGCAASQGFATLIAARVVQGTCGGAMIPAVFTAVYTLFPERLHVRATAVAGTFAMLAPTLGPTLGGYITETFDWHWLFLVNLGPGIVAGAMVWFLLRAEPPDWTALRRLDGVSLLLLATFLTALEILLKEAPARGWSDPLPLSLLVVSAATGPAGVWRCLSRPAPLVELRLFRERRFAVGCGFSFVLGAGLYSSVYLLPLFLGFVRQHSALEIGLVMIVTGAAQLVTAPAAAVLEKRVDGRLLTAAGYVLFALGLASNGFMTYETDFAELFWPQVLRGVAVMLCLLPTTAAALDGRRGEALADASGLFNLMRNLGGAIAIAIVDTIVQRRAPVHVAELVQRLQAGDREAARFVGLPLDRFHGEPLGPIDEATKQFVAPLLERAAAVASFNEAFLVLACLFAAALLAVPFLAAGRRGPVRPGDAG